MVWLSEELVLCTVNFLKSLRKCITSTGTLVIASSAKSTNNLILNLIMFSCIMKNNLHDCMSQAILAENMHSVCFTGIQSQNEIPALAFTLHFFNFIYILQHVFFYMQQLLISGYINVSTCTRKLYSMFGRSEM